LRKSFDKHELLTGANKPTEIVEYWKHLLLTPMDYGKDAIFDETARNLMNKITFTHGGEEYDKKYPEGIPTSVEIALANGDVKKSGLVMFPGGHARNTDTNLSEVLEHKFKTLGLLALPKNDLIKFIIGLENISDMSNEELESLYECNIKFHKKSVDEN
jgi:2-methylcitrate dehydratase